MERGMEVCAMKVGDEKTDRRGVCGKKGCREKNIGRGRSVCVWGDESMIRSARGDLEREEKETSSWKCNNACSPQKSSHYK